LSVRRPRGMEFADIRCIRERPVVSAVRVDQPEVSVSGGP
jgi:hypothetical protein